MSSYPELADELIYPNAVTTGHKLYSIEFFKKDENNKIMWTRNMIRKFIINNKMKVVSCCKTLNGWKLTFYPHDMFSSFSSEPKDAYNMVFGELKKKTHNIIE